MSCYDTLLPSGAKVKRLRRENEIRIHVQPCNVYLFINFLFSIYG